MTDKPPLQWATVNGQVFPMGINKAVEFDDSVPYIHQCECGNEIIEGDGDHHAFTDFAGKDQFICYHCSVQGMIELGDYREAMEVGG